MDPRACLRDICDALVNEDAEQFLESAEDLDGWLDKGGFCPSVEQSQLCILLNVLVTHVTTNGLGEL